MVIETKYSIGEEVWLMWENKPTTRKVEYIHISKSAKVQDTTYNLKHEDNYEQVIECDFCEDELFRTKKELLEDLWTKT